MSFDKELLADRLNEQPNIFRGCTSSELLNIAWISALIWLPVCVFFASLFGMMMAGFSVAAIGVGITIFVMATLFQKLKRNKPLGYYQHLLRHFLEDTGLWSSQSIRRTGHWSIGRTQSYIGGVRNKKEGL